MTKEQIREVLERVLTWPPARQEAAIEILMSIEAQDESGIISRTSNLQSYGGGAQNQIQKH